MKGLLILVALAVHFLLLTLPTPARAEQSTLRVIISEEIKGKLVPGEGTILLKGDVKPMKKAVKINGSRDFTLQGQKPEAQEFVISALVYRSKRYGLTSFLPPVGAATSGSSLKLTGSTTLHICINAQGLASLTVESPERLSSEGPEQSGLSSI